MKAQKRTALAGGLLLLALFWSGCAVGPNYKRPPIQAPAQFRGAPATSETNSIAKLPWWEMFQDPTLQELIRIGLTNSYDIRVAIARVEQARAIAAQTRAAYYPELNYQAIVGRGKNAVGTTPVTTAKTADVFLFGGNAAWEVDLWGRLRRLNEAARAQFLASQETRRDVMISVISEVAQNYFQLLALDRALEIARETTNSFGQSLTIFSQRMQGGIVSKLETSAAAAALASAAATVPDLARQIAVKENQINVLIGRHPGPVPRNRSLLQETLPPAVPAGLPAALLERRPDIRAVEQNLRAANAQVGVSVANFFPQFSLTGLFGQSTAELSALTSGAASIWSVAANLTGPLFQGGRLRAQYRQAVAVREEARWRYESTVLNALQEVSDALIAREGYAEARLQQAHAVEAYRVAVQVSMERYVAGRAGYFEVLQEQQLLFPAENTLNQVQLNQFLSLIQLYRALGGGWRMEDTGLTDKPAGQ